VIVPARAWISIREKMGTIRNTNRAHQIQSYLADINAGAIHSSEEAVARRRVSISTPTSTTSGKH
jgi:hypothetical protein